MKKDITDLNIELLDPDIDEDQRFECTLRLTFEVNGKTFSWRCELPRSQPFHVDNLNARKITLRNYHKLISDQIEALNFGSYKERLKKQVFGR